MNQKTLHHCALCGSQKTQKKLTSYNQHGRHLIDKKDTFEVFGCNECDCLFLTELKIDEKYYDKYYEKGYYEDKNPSIMQKLVSQLTDYCVRKKQTLITHHHPKKGQLSILDVGCGNGGFLGRLSHKKFKKTGLEINPEGAKICQKKGLRVINQNLLQLNEEEKFDVITLWHVLEHVQNPVEMLTKAKSLLGKDGLLIFEVPNKESMGYKYGKENWFHLDSPRHLILYNEKSVRKLCERTGFRIKAIKSEMLDYPLDLFWSVRNSPAKYMIYPFYPLAKILSKETLLFVCSPVE